MNGLVPRCDAGLPQTIGAFLTVARQTGVARLDAQLLVAHHLGRPRAWVIAHDEQPLAGSEAAWLDTALRKRAAGMPLAYLTGCREFHGLELRVSPAVLVPRPETEGLVDWALELLRKGVSTSQDVRVVDLGTGSGAVALAIKRSCTGMRVTATDCSEQALRVAQANAAALGLEVDFALGHWWQAVAGGCFDFAVSNPPYVAEGDPHLQHLRDEPRLALTAGDDGLSALSEIVDGAPAHLQREGVLLLEHGHQQAPAVGDMLRAAGFVDVSTREDLAGLPRCTGGRWPHAPRRGP